jgi:Protein of unknown function (DUF4199)
MKKIVLTFGLISGAISSLMMVITIPFMDKIGFGRGEILGYTTIVLSMLLVYAGIRSYRDNVAGGVISFKRAFGIGLLITVISCGCYVVTWEIMFFNLNSLQHFMDDYAAYTVDQAKAAGASPQEIQVRLEEMERFKELYKNPLFNAAMTFTEPFPVGLIISLISAAILRKKNHDPVAVAGTVVS